MAYGYENLTAQETADAALDKPLVGANLIPRSPTLVRWNAAGDIAGADLTVAGYPIARLYDKDPELLTKPTAGNVRYVVFNFGTTVDIDFVAICAGHNLGTSALTTLAFQIDQAQDGDFDEVDTIHLVDSYPTSSDDRIINLQMQHEKAITVYADAGGGQVTVTSPEHGLDPGDEIIISASANYSGTITVDSVTDINNFKITHSWDGDDGASLWTISEPKRYTDVQYCRLAMAQAGAFTPNITELVIGVRYQMPRWPNKDFNNDNIGDIGELGDPTKGGSVDSILTAENQFRMDDVEWTLKSSELAALKTWWKKTRGSYLWVWQPSTAPEAFNLMARDSQRLQIPFQGWRKHTFTISGIEQGPESKYLENE